MRKNFKRTSIARHFAKLSILLATPILAKGFCGFNTNCTTTDSPTFNTPLPSFSFPTSPNTLPQRLPTKPSENISVSNITDHTAKISFIDNATNEDGFKVYICNMDGTSDSSISPNPIIVPKNDSKIPYQSVTLTGLDLEKMYQLKITAFNQAGESPATCPSMLNGGTFMTGTPLVPEMPGEYVGVWNITESSARISFKDNSYNETGFKAYLYKYDTDELIDTLYLDAIKGTGEYQYGDYTNLEPDTLYKVRVSAYNCVGESELTTPSSLTNGRFRTDATCPAMPGEYVGVYNVTSTSARVSFLDNSDNEDGFNVYVYEYDSDTLIDKIQAEALEGVGDYQYANITNLTPDTLYKVRVSAYNRSCESEKTTPSSETNGRFRTEP